MARVIGCVCIGLQPYAIDYRRIYMTEVQMSLGSATYDVQFEVDNTRNSATSRTIWNRSQLLRQHCAG